MSNPDDVFCTNVQRPVDVAHPVAPVSCLEEHRRLCNAVLDGRVDVLRSLLVDGELDVNARSKTGNTAGHEVRAFIMRVLRSSPNDIIPLIATFKFAYKYMYRLICVKNMHIKL